jgi:hypothetical protein
MKILELIGAEQVLRDATPAEIADVEARKTAPAPVPPSVTRRQARQALLLNSLLAQVDPIIAAMQEPDRGLAQIWWADSLDFERNHALVVQVGAALGLDAAGLDALFVQAARL